MCLGTVIEAENVVNGLADHLETLTAPKSIIHYSQRLATLFFGPPPKTEFKLEVAHRFREASLWDICEIVKSRIIKHGPDQEGDSV
jgi:hypothetical protein